MQVFGGEGSIGAQQQRPSVKSFVLLSEVIVILRRTAMLKNKLLHDNAPKSLRMSSEKN